MTFPGRWPPDSQDYRKACLRLATNLDNFKRDPIYIKWVGNDVRPASVVADFAKEVRDMPYVFANDRKGNPVLHSGMSAGTLRYMQVVKRCQRFQYSSVAEIGGGYGGQALVHRRLTGIEDYTIIDVPEAIALQSAYLDFRCKFISTDDFSPWAADLLISDFALTELDDAGIDFYLEHVSFRYFHITGQNIERVAKKLDDRGYVVEVTAEQPQTSHHKNYLCVGYASPRTPQRG